MQGRLRVALLGTRLGASLDSCLNCLGASLPCHFEHTSGDKDGHPDLISEFRALTRIPAFVGEGYPETSLPKVSL